MGNLDSYIQMVEQRAQEYSNALSALRVAKQELADAASPYKIGQYISCIRLKARTEHFALIENVTPPDDIKYLSKKTAAVHYQLVVRIVNKTGKLSKMQEYIHPADVRKVVSQTEAGHVSS